MKNKLFLLFLFVFIFSNSITYASNVAYKCNTWEFEYLTSARLFWKRITECVTNKKASALDLEIKRYETEFERKNNFKSSDRVHASTIEYNCHSLSFNKSNFRMNYPNNIFLEFNTWWKTTNIYSAKKWDRWVIFERDNSWIHTIKNVKYNINHSFIFLEDYKGLTTKIKSKYWSFWEYNHTLKDVLNVYQTKDGIVTVLKYDNWNNFMYRSSNFYNVYDNFNSYTKISSLLWINEEYSSRDVNFPSNKNIIDSINTEDLLILLAYSNNDISTLSNFIKNKNINLKRLLLTLTEADKIYLIDKINKNWFNNSLPWKIFLEIINYEISN